MKKFNFNYTPQQARKIDPPQQAGKIDPPQQARKIVIAANPGFAVVGSDGSSLEQEIVIGWMMDKSGHYWNPITLGCWNGNQEIPNAVPPQTFGILYPDGLVYSPDAISCFGTLEQFKEIARAARDDDDNDTFSLIIPARMWERAKTCFNTQDPEPYLQEILKEACAADLERQQAAHLSDAGTLPMEAKIPPTSEPSPSDLNPSPKEPGTT
jgi:hypothetical protein